MADLEEGFELCKIPHGVELLGIEKHCDEDKVILTFKSREILVYNIADRKIVKSWSVEPNQTLSCPAVQDISTKKYYMVRDEKLLTWDDSVSDLRKVECIHSYKAIKRIHIFSSKAFHHEPVIVFKDNEVLPISFIRKEVAQKSQEPKQRLLWCGVCKHTDGKIWLSKILTSQNCMKVLLVIQPFQQSSAEKAKQHVYSINSPNSEVKLLCWSFLNDDEQSLYISLWSDGCVYKTEVPLVNSTELDEKKMAVLGCELVSRWSEVSLSTSKTQNIYISHVYSSYFCVAGTTTLDGESSKEEDIISMLDIKFGTLHSQKSLSNLTNVETAAVLGISHLQCTSSFVIVANNSSVIACSYKAERSTLRNSLGMLCDTLREGNQVKPLFLGTPKLIKPSEVLYGLRIKSIQDWTELVSKTDETEDEILRRLLDPKKTKTAKHFSNELQNYLEDSKDKPDDEQNELSKRRQRRIASKPPVVSQYFVTSVFQRCLKEKELWSSETGTILLKTTVLPQSCFSDFLGLVIANNQIKLFQECLQTLNGIPETSIVDCLNYILRVNDNVFGSSCENEETWIQTNPPAVSLSKAKFLCLLLAYPINDVFMQESLKRLPFEEMLLFVKFLLHIIRCWTVSLGDFLKSEDAIYKLTYVQILDWAGLTLNAHFTQLIVLPEAQTLLVNLHQAVAEQINTYENLEKLEGYLSHFKNHGPLPRKDYLGAYTVESVDV